MCYILVYKTFILLNYCEISFSFAYGVCEITLKAQDGAYYWRRESTEFYDNAGIKYIAEPI